MNINKSIDKINRIDAIAYDSYKNVIKNNRKVKVSSNLYIHSNGNIFKPLYVDKRGIKCILENGMKVTLQFSDIDSTIDRLKLLKSIVC